MKPDIRCGPRLPTEDFSKTNIHRVLGALFREDWVQNPSKVSDCLTCSVLACLTIFPVPRINLIPITAAFSSLRV